MEACHKGITHGGSWASHFSRGSLYSLGALITRATNGSGVPRVTLLPVFSISAISSRVSYRTLDKKQTNMTCVLLVGSGSFGSLNPSPPSAPSTYGGSFRSLSPIQSRHSLVSFLSFDTPVSRVTVGAAGPPLSVLPSWSGGSWCS